MSTPELYEAYGRKSPLVDERFFTKHDPFTIYLLTTRWEGAPSTAITIIHEREMDADHDH